MSDVAIPGHAPLGRLTGRRWSVRAGLRYPLSIAALALAYYGAAKIGYVLDFAGPVAAIVWFPAGVGIAALYLGGLRLVPGVIAGDLLANDYGALPLGSALGQTAGNVLEMVVATVLLRWLIGHESPMSTVAGVGRMLVAVMAGTAVSATVGTTSLWLGDVLAGSSLPTVWRTWWLGDTTGALVIVPFALAWWHPARPAWTRRRALEAAALLVAVTGLSELTLRTERPISYLVFPALLWAGLRFGARGATLAVAIAAAAAIWNTTHYQGPFVYDDLTHAVLSTQLYIGVAAVSTLCLAALVCEREAFAERFGASRALVADAADAERRRIERNLHDGAQQRLLALAVHLRLGAEEARLRPGEAALVLRDAEAQLQLAVDELRQLAHGMHPAVLTNLGLADALRSLAARSGVPMRLVELPARRVDETAEATAYYVVSEAVANAQRHARASRVTVRAVAAGPALHVEVTDDGGGGAAESAGSGLDGLRDRVEAIGGTFQVHSPRGRGTRICAAIPASSREGP